MKTEKSAGGVIIRRRTTTWEVLVLRDKKGEWTFPKGKIEPGESIQEAATREIAEEVGLKKIRLQYALPAIRYLYKRNGIIHKTVHFFIFEATGDEPIVNQTEEGIHEATWMPITKALHIIGYPKTNKPLLIWTLKKLRT